MTADLAARDLVYAALGRGRDNAESIGALSERLHLSRREVEQSVQDLRLGGIGVASGSDGVWLGDAEEMAQTAAILRGRLVTQYRTWKAVRATERRLRGAPVHQLTWMEVA